MSDQDAGVQKNRAMAEPNWFQIVMVLVFTGFAFMFALRLVG